MPIGNGGVVLYDELTGVNGKDDVPSDWLYQSMALSTLV